MTRRNLPFRSNTEIRPTRFGSSTLVWLSATYTSPLLGSVTPSFGSVNASGGSPFTPGLPKVMSTLPSGLNLITTLPFLSSPGNLVRSSAVGTRASVTHTVSISIDVDAVWPDEHAAAKAPDLLPGLVEEMDR